MRTALLLGILVAVLVPAAGAAGPAPSLRLVDSKPLTLRGDNFRGGERVFVVMRTNRPYARTVEARSDGSFTIQFPTTTLVRCARITASARGASGTHAALPTRRVFCTSERIHPPLLPAVSDR
jgi:hypothetical protein